MKYSTPYDLAVNEEDNFISQEFIDDIKSTKSLKMFWVSFYINKSDTISQKFYIKTDYTYDYKLVIDLSYTGLNNCSYYNLENYPYLKFYYRVSNESTEKLAFGIKVGSTNNQVRAYTYARNIITLDLSNYRPKFNFLPAFDYKDYESLISTTTKVNVDYLALPIHQHYHVLESLDDENKDSNNAVDGYELLNLIKDQRTSSADKELNNYLIKVKIDDETYNWLPRIFSNTKYLGVNNSNIFQSFDNTVDSPKSSVDISFPTIRLNRNIITYIGSSNDLLNFPINYNLFVCIPDNKLTYSRDNNGEYIHKNNENKYFRLEYVLVDGIRSPKIISIGNNRYYKIGNVLYKCSEYSRYKLEVN